MYHSYHTKAFILGSFNAKDANKVFLLYTKELGLIKASAQGVRLLKSKLRYGLQDFSYLTVSLIKGKESWKITGATEVSNIFTEHKENKELFLIFARVFSLLKRLLHGEEKNEALFIHLTEAYNFAKNNIPKELFRSYEYILALRILKSLGYLGDSEVFGDFVTSPYWTLELLKEMEPVKNMALLHIKDSLQETQL